MVLTDRQEELIGDLVGSGRYQNASEVLPEGLRLIEQREVEDAARLKVLCKAARAGFDALDRGEFKEFDSIDDLQTYLNAISENSADFDDSPLDDAIEKEVTPAPAASGNMESTKARHDLVASS